MVWIGVCVIVMRGPIIGMSVLYEVLIPNKCVMVGLHNNIETRGRFGVTFSCHEVISNMENKRGRLVSGDSVDSVRQWKAGIEIHQSFNESLRYPFHILDVLDSCQSNLTEKKVVFPGWAFTLSCDGLIDNDVLAKSSQKVRCVKT